MQNNDKKKCVILIFGILSTFFLFLLIPYLNYKNDFCLKKFNEKISKIILTYYKEEVNKSVLLSYSDLKELSIKEEILNKVNEDSFCAKIYNDGTKYNEVIIYNNSCDYISYDLSGSNAPVLPNNSLKVKNYGEKFIITDFENWYDYDNGKVATIAMLKSNNIHNYKVNDTVKLSDIERIMIWIPMFFYNEDKDLFSYRNDVGFSFKHDISTAKNIPFTFYYQNRELYGYWIDIYFNTDIFDTSYNLNLSNTKLMKLNNDIIESYNLFMKHYGGEKYSINLNAHALLIGKGKFYEKAY